MGESTKDLRMRSTKLECHVRNMCGRAVTYSTIIFRAAVRYARVARGRGGRGQGAKGVGIKSKSSNSWRFSPRDKKKKK